MSHRAMSMAASVWIMRAPPRMLAMGAEDFLPEILDARRVLVVEQLEQRLDERLGYAWIDPLEIAPADDAVVSSKP